MPLSTDELTDFRSDIGDTNSAFSDAEIQRLYTRANDSYEYAMILGIDQLISNAVKFADYTSGASSERSSQIFDNLLKMRELWEVRYGRVKQQIRITGARISKYPKSDPYA